MAFFELIVLLSLFSAETKLLPPVMDDSESLSKIKHILQEYLFFLFRLIQTKSLVLKRFNFLHNYNILLQKAGMAICFSVMQFHSRVGSDTCGIEKYMVYGFKLPHITLLLVQTTICFQIVKYLHR